MTDYYVRPLLAYARALATPDDVRDVPGALAVLATRGVRASKFVRRPLLPRVAWAIETLRALAPTSLLDVAPGRYASLWPLLDAFPTLAVTVTDPPDGAWSGRAPELLQMRDHGLTEIVDALAHPAERLAGVADGTFDVATLFEVLEHVEDPAAAARELLRVVRRAVLVTVPGCPDQNPDHKRLYTPASLGDEWRRAGAARVTVTALGPAQLVALVEAP